MEQVPRLALGFETIGREESGELLTANTLCKYAQEITIRDLTLSRRQGICLVMTVIKPHAESP